MKSKISSETKNPKISLKLLELNCLDKVVGGLGMALEEEFDIEPI